MKDYRSYVDNLGIKGWEFKKVADNEDTVAFLDKKIGDMREKRILVIEHDYETDTEFPVFLYNGLKDYDKYIEFRENMILRNDVKQYVKRR